jgi:hypothetical protein
MPGGRRAAMKPALPSTALALCVLYAAGCDAGAGTATPKTGASGAARMSAAAAGRLRGDGDEDGGSAVASERSKPDADNDSDNEGRDYYDWDDSNVLDYGHQAGAADARAIASAVARYYAAAVRGDGRAVCRFISAGVAGSMRSEFGSGSSPLAVGGTSCQAIASKLLTRLHLDVSVAGLPPTVGPARVEGDSADVLLTFEGTHPNRYTVVRRERGAWKVDRLLSVGLP